MLRLFHTSCTRPLYVPIQAAVCSIKIVRIHYQLQYKSPSCWSLSIVLSHPSSSNAFPHEYQIRLAGEFTIPLPDCLHKLEAGRWFGSSRPGGRVSSSVSALLIVHVARAPAAKPRTVVRPGAVRGGTPGPQGHGLHDLAPVAEVRAHPEARPAVVTRRRDMDSSDGGNVCPVLPDLTELTLHHLFMYILFFLSQCWRRLYVVCAGGSKLCHMEGGRRMRMRRCPRLICRLCVQRHLSAACLPKCPRFWRLHHPPLAPWSVTCAGKVDQQGW